MEQLSHGAREIQNNKIYRNWKKNKKEEEHHATLFLLLCVYTDLHITSIILPIFLAKNADYNGCGGVRAYIRVNNNFMFVDS